MARTICDTFCIRDTLQDALRASVYGPRRHVTPAAPRGKDVQPRYAPQLTRRKQQEGERWCICHRVIMQCTDPWRTISMTYIGLILKRFKKRIGHELSQEYRRDS